MSSLIHETTTTKTNNNTGEVIESTDTKSIIRYPRTADFVMAFTKDLQYMRNLTKGEMLTLFGLLKIVLRNENSIILNSTVKKTISTEFDIKVGTIDMALTALVKKKILSRTGRGVYLLNPNLFGKGNWADIKKLRMYTEWDFQNEIKKVDIQFDYLSEEEIEAINYQNYLKMKEKYEAS